MSTTDFRIDANRIHNASMDSLQEYLPGVEIISYAVGARRGGAPPTTATIAIDDHILVIAEFDNGIQWCYEKAAFVAAVAEQQPNSRAQDNAVPELPLLWRDNRSSRGMASGALKLLGINLIKITGASQLQAIAARIEAHNGNILYQCDRELNLLLFHDTISRDVSPRYLLLLHGAGSGTRNTFLGLKQEQGGKIYDALYKRYNGNIIAYEHRTLTQDPVRNAIDLLRQLPDKIELDLLSHSRGGLIGEILARMSTAGVQVAFTPQEIALLEQNPEATVLLADIRELHTLLQKKKVVVLRFVRVACPAAGTTLVSENMDALLNVLFNILHFAHGETVNDVTGGIRALTLAVLHGKSNIEMLPGIACMRPDASLIKVLNFRETQIDSPLFIIAGAAQEAGLTGRLQPFLMDIFAGEDNDLVVDTASMKRGTPRRPATGFYEERRGHVNHFNYFVIASLLDVICDVLTGNGLSVRHGATVLEEDNQEQPPAIEAPVSRAGTGIADQPVLYVLPGIMGSHLQDGADRIWLDYFRMATGGLRRLHIDAATVTASGINGSAYSDLVHYFADTHYVIPYAYDWRKSVFDAASLLNEAVSLMLEKTDQPVCFVAHSMGGLVLRALAVKYPDTWKALQERSSFRVLLLGTPNEGSYEIPRVLLGRGRNINLVALLDITQSKRALLAQFVRYPGLLNLLPVSGDNDFRKKAHWEQIAKASGLGYPLPDVRDLRTFAELMHPPFRDFRWDAATTVYIAGKDKLTAKKIAIDVVNGKVDFYGTPRGDGSVTWDSIPGELQAATYYVEARHGDLAAHENAFPAYRELLKTGSTALLPAIAPAPRGEEERLLLMPEAAPALPTGETELSKRIMGMAVPASGPGQKQVRLSITHGDMGHALYPLVAGHFAGDSIVQAEQVLNRKLGGYLAIRYDTGNYPGRIGTHEIVFKKDARPSGGVVVGLGDFGSLTENTFYLTLRQALMSYVTACAEQEPGKETAGISTLLVGSGFGGLTIYSCIRAVIMAVGDVNAFFDPALRRGYPFIDHIEFVELYQYKAVQAARIINSLLSGSDLFSGFLFSPDLIKRVSGSQNRIPDDIQADWWHRLKVYEADPSAQNKQTRLIRFSSITDKARNEEEILAANIGIVDQLIARAAVYSRNDPGLYEALYEMLIPAGFKGYGSDLRNIVLIVDKETARYPWEMLHDAFGGSTEPIVTRTGFIRQLSTTTFRPNSELSRGDNALVIGNPQVRKAYPDLPGAAREAASVAQQLKERHFEVTTFISQPGAEAMTSLYSRNYKILHIAAHGVVNERDTGRTGVVLGDALILTPADFKQIRYVPELVFINCCSLGTISKEEEERLQRKYEVAAGVGTQLIEMGARAVIVAGWEVDDAAAKCFSESVYHFLLEGRPFGEAVRFARKLTYDGFPQVSTWGAYQCYGDPFYTLRNSGGAQKANREQYYDIVEAINRLETFISKAEAATGRYGNGREEKLKQELEAILDGIQARPEWKDAAPLLALIAEAFQEMDCLEEAIPYYERLLALDDSGYTFRTVEQYCDTRIRYAIECIDELARQDQVLLPDVLEDAAATVRCMIAQLQGLGSLCTSGRLNVIASGYKALATLDLYRGHTVFDNLAAAAGYYRQSFEQRRKNNAPLDGYPFCNWLQLAAVLDHVLPEQEKATHAASGLLGLPPGWDQPLHAGEELLLSRTATGFWYKVSDGMAMLVLLLRSMDREEIGRYEVSVADNFHNALKVEGSQKKIRSVIRYLRLLAGLLALSGDMIVPAKIVALNRIASVLERPEAD
ncbi:CHAT domain-containing protein [Taibaiella koreensis]|uniref:CHAT domain-containing protein n=1 Tax=Taibaiella koreensis TaxID=1268548 RepID=UPI0013C33C96|nr:CHAT domain-containing protein [Taibaiella koreensis]